MTAPLPWLWSRESTGESLLVIWAIEATTARQNWRKTADMLLITRDQAPAHRFVLSQVRHQIETTFSQLWWKFVDRVFSRSWTGLWNTLQLKVLYYNLRHAGILSA